MNTKQTSPENGRVEGRLARFSLILKGAIVLFLPLAAVTAFLIGLVYFNHYATEKKRYKEVTQVQVEALRKLLNLELGRVLEDIRFLADSVEFQSLLDQPTSENERKLIDSWRQLAEQRKIYDKIRFIDSRGMETIRINYKSATTYPVSQAELQFKAHRYYFEEAMVLGRGEIFVSPFDLNKEHGAVERPYKPMIRVAMPVYDRNSSKRGIVVLNYLAARLLHEINTYAKTSHGSVNLLNADGYYLRGIQREREWGFMFPGRGDRYSLRFDYPQAWSAISMSATGQFENAAGIFTFQHISFPTEEVNLESGIQRTWILMNFESAAALGAKLTSMKHTAWLLAGAMLPVLFIISLIISRSRLQRSSVQEALQVSEERNRLILEAVADGIYGIDARGNTTFVNPAALKLLGYTYSEIINRPVHDLIHHSYPDGSHYPEKACRITLSIEKAIIQYVNEEVFWRKDGSSFPVEYTSIPIVQNGVTKGAVITFRDITRRKKAEEKLRRLATTDHLTGIFNRKRFEELLRQEIRRSNRYGTRISVAMFDLDHFKRINDTHGHEIGDKVLQEVAELTKQNLRETDIFSRWGGEEFMILALETDRNGIMRLAEKTRLAIARHAFDSVNQVTASFGIAQYQPGESPASFMKRLDEALYKAKNAGRNCIRDQNPALKVVHT